MSDLRVVVGMDSSLHAREALRWALRLRDVLGGEIVAVHALGLLEELDGELVPAHRRRAEIEQLLVREWCGFQRPDRAPIRTVVRTGHPMEVLLAVAADEQADLIVMGSRGAGSAPAFALGSTSLHVLRAAPIPVLVVPEHDVASRHLGLRRVLVGVDGPSSDAAVDVACGVAAAFGAWITVVEAVDDLVDVADEHVTGRLRERVVGCGVPAHIAVRRGRPDEVVAGVARLTDADLVVTGRRRRSSGAPLIDGSISRQVVRIGQRPTLVVPDGSAPARLTGRRPLLQHAS